MDFDISWDLYRSYLGVLRHGSLSAAARAMGVAQPTVGRHVAALEQQLGITLFTRAPAGLLPTEAGLALKPYAETMLASTSAMKRAAHSQGEVRGTVRLTSSEIIGSEVLPPIITALQARWPALKIELVLSNQVQDLLNREADIAVRMTAPRQEALIARHLGSVELGLHAHARYLHARGTPATLDDLLHHALIGFDQQTPFLRAASEAIGQWRRQHFSLRSDSDLAQLAMLRAGAGLGVCQVPLAHRDPQLVRVLPGEFSLPLDTWLAMHEDLRHTPRCRVVFDALLEGLQAYLNGTSDESTAGLPRPPEIKFHPHN